MAVSFLVHDFSQYAPDWPVACGAPAETYDEPLLRRIAAALRHSLDRTTSAGDGLWAPIVARHRPFVDLLATGQLRNANALLARMFSTSLTFGFEQSEELYNRATANVSHQQHIRLFAADKLLSLAAFCRAIPVHNVEQGDFTPYLKEHPDSLLSGIEKKLGRPIRSPAFQGKLFGITTDRGIFTERNLTGIYVALRIKDIVNNLPDRSICEIGGGAGYVAYYCRWLDMNDYTIVDLPTVSAVQAYFLAHNLGGADQVFLSGEMVDGSRGVKLINAIDFAAGVRKFDLIVNVDSFPEMSGAAMRGYLNTVRSRCRYLLSINQEAMAARSQQPGDRQERVGDVIDEIGGFRRLARVPFWMRPGYVEEVYETT